MVMVAAVEHAALLLSYWRGHSTQGWALASRWRSRPIHARDGGSTSTGLAMGLCCLPPPPPCAGESIRQFTLLWATRVSPPATYSEIRHQKWFTVEAVDVLQGVGRRERRPPSFRSPTYSEYCAPNAC